MMIMRRSLVATCVFTALIAACGSDSSTAPAPDIATATFASTLNVHLSSMTKTASGLYYQDSVAGSGNVAQAGRSVSVNYVGWLINGTQFDASASHGGPFAFTLGVGQVIAGWDEGVAGMKVGGWRKLVIPSSLGYGSAGSGPIPGNAILVFNVQLVAAQ